MIKLTINQTIECPPGPPIAARRPPGGGRAQRPGRRGRALGGRMYMYYIYIYIYTCIYTYSIYIYIYIHSLYVCILYIDVSHVRLVGKGLDSAVP